MLGLPSDDSMIRGRHDTVVIGRRSGFDEHLGHVGDLRQHPFLHQMSHVVRPNQRHVGGQANERFRGRDESDGSLSRR